MSISNLNRNFQTGNFPAIDTRGAFNVPPVEGSSNIQIAGRLAPSIQAATQGTLPGLGEGDIFNNPDFRKMPPDLQRLYLDKYGPSPENRFLDRITSDEFLKQQEAMEDRRLEKGLAAYQKMGDQQMKYRLTNDIIANLGAGARAAAAGYTDPAEIARMTSGIGDAYARGAAATEGLTRLGAGIPVTRYYNV